MMVVFGGSGAGTFLDDTWAYDSAAGTWTQLTVGGVSPSARSRHHGVYVPGMSVVFFGGQTANGLSNQLWILAAALEPGILDGGAVNAFNYEGGAVAPGEIISIFTRNAGPRLGL